MPIDLDKVAKLKRLEEEIITKLKEANAIREALGIKLLNTTMDGIISVPPWWTEAAELRANGMTLEMIGEKFGVTRERVRQILGKVGVVYRKYMRPEGQFRRPTKVYGQCPNCNADIHRNGAVYCSRACQKAYAFDQTPVPWMLEAVAKVQAGMSYTEAAGGFSNRAPTLHKYMLNHNIDPGPLKVFCRRCQKAFFRERRRALGGNEFLCTECEQSRPRKYGNVIHYHDGSMTTCGMAVDALTNISDDKSVITCRRCLRTMCPDETKRSIVRQVMALLTAASGPMMASDIIAKIRGAPTSVYMALSALKSTGHVVNPKRGQWMLVQPPAILEPNEIQNSAPDSDTDS
jgi:DNA-binding transcriptional ArsR family regulator